MATTVNLRQVLDRKQWEMCAPLNPGATLSSYQTVCVSTLFDGYQFWLDNNSTSVPRLWLYDPRQDSFLLLTDGSQTMSSGASSTCCAFHPNGPTGTASAGGAKTITTVSNITGSLVGYSVRITGGTGAGQEQVIVSNTFGANSVITVTSNWATQPDATSVYLLLTGRVWVFSGTGTGVSMKYYDVALGTWSTSRSVSSGPPTSVSEYRFTATPAFGNTVASGTATAGAATTLTNSIKAWATNMWANSQVRLTGGTGAGQVRTISSNTGTVLTVSASWGTNPDVTSTYVIEPNDDFLYVAGNAAITLYRYSISGDSWSTLSPGTARTAAVGNGCCLLFIPVASDTSWADETNIRNGRYLYSFQGGVSGNLSYYDIAANTWINLTTTYRNGGGNTAVDFGPTFGWSSTSDREFIYYAQLISSSSPTRVYRYNCVTQTLEPFSTFPLPYFNNQGTGNRLIVGSYTDGGTVIRWLYYLAFVPQATVPAPLFRVLII